MSTVPLAGPTAVNAAGDRQLKVLDLEEAGYIIYYTEDCGAFWWIWLPLGHCGQRVAQAHFDEEVERMQAFDQQRAQVSA